MTRLLASAPNEFVADIILQRLAEGGVQACPIGRPMVPTTFAVGQIVGQDIYVEDDDFERAREILREAESAGEGLSEDDAAVQWTQPRADPKKGKPHKPAQTSVPRAGTIRTAIRKLAKLETKPDSADDQPQLD